jgi:hypothetical protein
MRGGFCVTTPGGYSAAVSWASRTNGMSTRPCVSRSRTSRSTGHARASAEGRSAVGTGGLRSGGRTVPATESRGTRPLRRPPGLLSGERPAVFDSRFRNHWDQVSFALPTGERNVMEQLGSASR